MNLTCLLIRFRNTGYSVAGITHLYDPVRPRDSHEAISLLDSMCQRKRVIVTLATDFQQGGKGCCIVKMSGLNSNCLYSAGYSKPGIVIDLLAPSARRMTQREWQ